MRVRREQFDYRSRVNLLACRVHAAVGEELLTLFVGDESFHDCIQSRLGGTKQLRQYFSTSLSKADDAASHNSAFTDELQIANADLRIVCLTTQRLAVS
jgi:hypothetical protein